MTDTDKSTTETTDAPASSDNDVATLPEWGRKAISEANAEAAKYRVQAKTIADQTRAEVEAQFSQQLKTVSEEKSATVTERDSYATNLTKLKVALAAEIPGDKAVAFAALLQGSTEADLLKHAAELKSMFGSSTKTRPVDPTHGATGGNDSPADQFAALIQSKLTPRN